MRPAPESPHLLQEKTFRDRSVLITITLFACLSIYCAVRSEGFIAADACTHYLYARFAVHEPVRFVDVWARPLVTAIYALPAMLGGRIAVRFECLLIAIGCGWVAMRIAAGQQLRLPALALLFTLGQPLLFFHSFGEMTELPFALLLGSAFLAYQHRRLNLAAFLIAWSPLARPEGFGFLLLMTVALLLHRRWLGLALLPLPLIAWDIAGWLLTARTVPWWRWLPHAWPYSTDSVYGSGSLFTFVAVLPIVVSPLVLPAMLIGIRLALSPFSRPGENAHLRRSRILIAILPIFVLVVHTLLYWTGKLASFGEARYLLVVAPFWGVLSALGWEWIFTRLRWRHPFAWGAAAVLIVPLIANAIHPVVPVSLPPDWQTARNLAEWWKTPDMQTKYPRIMAAHPGIFYFTDISPCDERRTNAWDKQTIATRPPNTLLIWDPLYSEQNSLADHAILLDEIRRAGWIELPEVNSLTDGHKHSAGDARHSWHVFTSAGR